MRTLSELMSRSVVTASPGTTVAEAATLMSTNRVGSVLVCEGERLLGIFTERDIVRALATDFDAAGQHVTSWMSADPIVLGSAASADEALDLMLERGFRHVPVVDGEQVVGVVSIRDLTTPRSAGD